MTTQPPTAAEVEAMIEEARPFDDDWRLCATEPVRASMVIRRLASALQSAQPRVRAGNGGDEDDDVELTQEQKDADEEAEQHGLQYIMGADLLGGPDHVPTDTLVLRARELAEIAKTGTMRDLTQPYAAIVLIALADRLSAPTPPAAQSDEGAFEAFQITAADYNGQTWDGSPFRVPPSAPYPDWLSQAVSAGRVRVKPDDRDYAVWAVLTNDYGQPRFIAEPGDWIVNFDGALAVLSDEAYHAARASAPSPSPPKENGNA